jgi:ATP-binding cassette subfamily B protein
MNTAKIPIRQYTQLLQNYLKTQHKSIIWLAVLLFVGIAMQLINPQIIRYFLDSAENGQEARSLWIAAALFIAVTLLQQIINIIATYISENVGWIATNKLRGDVAEHCMKLDMSFHKSHTAGSIIERVDGDINNLANFFANFAVSLLSNMVLMFGIIVLLFFEGWLIGTGMLLFTIFAIWMIQYIRKFSAPYWVKMRQMSSKFYGFLGEHLEGTEDTRANGATDYVMHRFYMMLREWFPIRMRAFFGFATMWITTLIVFAIGNGVAFAICAILWKNGTITLGTVYMIFYYTELMVKPIEKIRTQMEDLQKADASITRVRELLQTESRIKDGPGAVLSEGALAVKLDGVSFGYEENGDTLEEISFQLERGKALGLLGATGSGKTTLARLLLRFYDPQSGGVYLDGIDIRELTLHELRRKVGLVTQNIEIFQANVRDNVTMYDDMIPDERIVEVIEQLGLYHWFHSLPLGLDTPLESGGGGLSAGEAQLLSFARVFLTNPGLVILDEASSRLDPATEHQIEKAISRMLQGRTCIIIAHRLTTIARVDQVLVLDQGRIIEFGNRNELAMDKSTRFSRMLIVGMEEITI